MEKRSLIIVLCTTLLLLGMLYHPAVAETKKERDTKDMNNALVTSHETDALAIPPIDAAAPSTFETASFGLG